MSPRTVRNWASVPPNVKEAAPNNTTTENQNRFMRGENACLGESLATSKQRQQATAQPSIVGHKLELVLARNRLMPEIATGAFEDQSARGNVPQTDAGLDVTVHPAARHVSQRQCRRAHDAHFAHPVG